ncbi:MAG: recombination protein NinG [Ramlibacter sp.]|nr:recombination protein NinG [Ramlibacter sp.]
MTLTAFNPKPKTCAGCDKMFVPARPMQAVCGPRCAVKKVKADKAEARAKIRTRKEAIKTVPVLIAEAQDAFNAFIRERDKARGCFVCGKPFPAATSLGGVMDAGHVRSRGAAGHLRFNEDNCHGECKACNSSFGAKPHQIEAGAVRRIGRQRYEALVADNTPHKWTHDELRTIRDGYRARLRDMKAAESIGTKAFGAMKSGARRDP